MKTTITIILTAAIASFVSIALSAYFLYKKWQPVRATLEDVVFADRVDIGNRTLGDAVKAIVSQVQKEKHVTLRSVYAPEDLANKLPIRTGFFDGSAFFAIATTERIYGCKVRFAGDDLIVLTPE